MNGGDLDAQLDDGHRAVIRRLTQGPDPFGVWAEIDDQDALTFLEALGVVVRWTEGKDGAPLDGGARVTLTPWGAERLGLELDEDDRGVRVESADGGRVTRPAETPYWRGADPRPWTRRPPKGVRTPREGKRREMPLPELLAAPYRSPLDALCADEKGVPIVLFGRTIVRSTRVKGKGVPKPKMAEGTTEATVEASAEIPATAAGEPKRKGKGKGKPKKLGRPAAPARGGNSFDLGQLRQRVGA
jgi:hypothetical protein